MKTLTLAAAVAGTLLASTADAHGIWFAQRSANYTALIYGVGADDLDAVKRLPLVQSVAGYDADLEPVPTSLKATGPLAVVDSEGDVAVVTAVLFNGIWAKMPDGEWVKKGRDEAPNAVIAEKNYKYAVHLRKPLGVALKALPGQTLQILPVAATIPQSMGETLALRVMFQGKPVAGARVLSDYVNDPDGKPLVTGKDGLVTIAIRNQGLNVVTATFDGPSDEPTKADKMEHLATLSFVLPHLPE